MLSVHLACSRSYSFFTSFHRDPTILAFGVLFPFHQKLPSAMTRPIVQNFLNLLIAGSPPISLLLIVGKSKCDGKASVTRLFLFFRKKILIATGLNRPHPNPPNQTQATNNNRPSALTPSPSVKPILELALCPQSWPPFPEAPKSNFPGFSARAIPLLPPLSN